MAHILPVVRNGMLFLQQQDSTQAIVVDSPDWQHWLAEARMFLFVSESEPFTARKERARNQPGSWYWRAYAYRQGQRYRLYLGKTEELTLARLSEASVLLNKYIHAAQILEAQNPSAEAINRPQIQSRQKKSSQHLSFTSSKQPWILLSTKFSPPPLQEPRIVRQRLLVQAENLLRHPLTVIRAPAGSGKTTLLSQWYLYLSQKVHGPSLAWLSLDSYDQDPLSFWHYILTALNHCIPGLADEALSLLLSAQAPPLQTILTILLNNCAEYSDDFVLMLDDYHLSETSAIHESMAFFCQHLPARFHLVISSRHDPELPLARLRTQQTLLELHAINLHFTLAETHEFLQTTMGLTLSESTITTLANSSEGWIAALQLAALFLKELDTLPEPLLPDQSPLTNHYMLDYLTEEILAQQTSQIQMFLLHTCIVPQLHHSLCNALTGENNGQEILRILERKNLFLLPLDSQHSWYRYHHLFAEILRNLLHKSFPDQISTLHLKASQWYEEHGQPLEAIEQAFAADNLERAAHLIENFTLKGWSRKDSSMIRKWFARLSVDLTLTRPQLTILSTWLSWYEIKPPVNLQAHLKDLLSSIHYYYGSLQERRIIEGEITSFLAALDFLQGMHASAIQQAQHALELLPPAHYVLRMLAIQTLINSASQSGKLTVARQTLEELMRMSEQTNDVLSALNALYHLGGLYSRQGKLYAAASIYRQAIALSEEKYHSMGFTGIYLNLIEIIFEWGDLDTAFSLLQKAKDALQPTTDPGIVMHYHETVTSLGIARRDFSIALTEVAETEAVLDGISALSDGPIHQQVKRSCAATRAYIALLCNDLASAQAWIKQCPAFEESENLSVLRVRELSILVRVHLAHGRNTEALAQLDALVSYVEKAQNVPQHLSLLLLQIRIYVQQCAHSIAMPLLARALTLAEPGNFLQTFIQEGPALLLLLQSSAFVSFLQENTHLYSVSPGYLKRLCAAFARSSSTITQKPSANPARDLLSPREIEVLYLMSEGLSDREIAARLVLAEGTVKTHAKRIYAKLQVKNRMQATRLARELSLF